MIKEAYNEREQPPSSYTTAWLAQMSDTPRSYRPVSGSLVNALVDGMADASAAQLCSPLITTVLNLSRTDRNFTKEFYRDPASLVYGWSIGLQRYHVSLDALLKQPILNLSLGKTALLATFDAESTEAKLFSRALEGRDLSFAAVRARQMRDEQTGSVWDVMTGEAIAGPLKGKRLDRRLGMFSYQRAWLTFYPTSKNVAPPQQ